MTFQATILLGTLLPIAASLGIAFLLIRWRRPGLGILSGLGLIALVEGLFQASLGWAVNRCIERACAAGGLEPSCEAARFGCTEWSGMSAFIFIMIGIVDAVVFLAGAALLVLRERRRNRPASSGAAPA
jgi:hypothetical protein